MRLAPVIALAVGLAGCLSSPTPREPDGNGDAGPDDDGGVLPGMAFPPDGANIAIRDVRNLDVNGDDIDDVVIVNNPGVATDRGVYVLLGPQSDAGALEYHLFIPTVAEPLDVLFADVLGESGLADLVVFGPAGGVAVVEIYEQIAELDFETTAVQSRDSGVMNIDRDIPNLVAVAALNDGVRNDFVVGDLDQLFAFIVNDAADLPTISSIPLGVDGTAATQGFSSINGILVRPTPTEVTDDLVIIENQDVHWLRNDGAGVLTNATSANNGSLFTLFTAVDSPLGSTNDTVLGASPEGAPGGFRLDPTGPSATPVVWNVDEVASLGFSDLLVGGLDTVANPEVVLLDTAGVDARVRIFRNAVEMSNEIEPLGSSDRVISGQGAAQGAIADLNNDDQNEVWLFDMATGAASCTVVINNAPAPCP